jgi:hypothetical protein
MIEHLFPRIILLPEDDGCRTNLWDREFLITYMYLKWITSVLAMYVKKQRTHPFSFSLPLWKSSLNVSVWVLIKGTSNCQNPEHCEPCAFSKETTDVRVLVCMQGITKKCQLLCCEIRKCLAPCSHASTRDSKTFPWWRTWGYKTYECVGRCTLRSSTSWVLLWVANFATLWDL